MYQHHEESIRNLVSYFKADEGVLAVILGGSVARGFERPDSDLDAIIVVTDEKLRQLTAENRLSEVVRGHCTYEGGYFDVKYCSLDFLLAAAERGNEPSRNAFYKARCLFSRDPDIERIVPRIGAFQRSEREEKLLSFYSAFNLFSGYFWRVSGSNTYLRSRAALEVVLHGYRMLLEEAGVLFACHKELEHQISVLQSKPDGILEKGQRLLNERTDEAKQAFVDAILGYIQYEPPRDYTAVLTRFIDDNELWWYKDRPIIAEW